MKCPLSAFNRCNEDIEVRKFGSHTKSSKLGRDKIYLVCPVHGSMRFDSPEAQKDIKEVLNISVTEKPVTDKLEVKPEVQKPVTEKPVTETEEDWGF